MVVMRTRLMIYYDNDDDDDQDNGISNNFIFKNPTI